MNKVFSIAFVVRILFLLYGNYHDSHALLKYTDVDYTVVSDGAEFVWRGGSPYDRPTYRYTPLLAWLLVANHAVHENCGKLLFCLGDLLCGWLILVILRKVTRTNGGGESVPPAAASSDRRAAAGNAFGVAVGLFLLNPLAVNVSTRGNSESLVCLSVLMTVYAAVHRWSPFVTGLLLAAAVHIKVYPVVYSVPLGLFVLRAYAGVPRSIKREQGAAASTHLNWTGFLQFALGCFVGLALLTALCFWLYGWPFLEAWLLFHVRRQDPKHNFSLHFLPTYLNAVAGAASASGSWLTKALAVLPQAAVTGAAGLRFHRTDRELCFGMFMQTFAFVAFNRVCTVQYFMWWLCLLPLSVPFFRWTGKRRVLAGAALAAWAAAHGAWGAFAYQLEFEGQPKFLQVWMASVAIFLANLVALCSFVILFDPKLKEA